MAQTVSVIVSAEERVRLAAIVGDRSRPLKHVQRARIVLHAADRLPVPEVARRASVTPPGGLALAAALLLDIGPDITPRAVLGDKGDDAKANREEARRRG